MAEGQMQFPAGVRGRRLHPIDHRPGCDRPPLLLGYYDENKLYYAGRVGTGWSHKLAEQIWTQLEPLKLAKSPFVSVDALGRRSAIWTRPRARLRGGVLGMDARRAFAAPLFRGLAGG